MEERLINLETRVAFQDSTLEILNTVLVKQQQEIIQLKMEMTTLKAQMRTQMMAPITHPAEETPPHY